MKRSSNTSARFLARLLIWPLLGCALLALGAFWIAPAALAQNIDAGKTAPRLFADSCVNCHRSPNSLAKGRFRPTLFAFLQDHYTTSMGAAWELAGYLAAVDTPAKGSKSKSAAAYAPAKPRGTTPRPPAPVQQN
jgi:mono/diheme cytochrome c family protein